MSFEFTQPPVEEENKENDQEHLIDLSEAWDKESAKNMFFEKIKELGLYREDLLYRGFPGEDLDVVLEKGFLNDHGEDMIHCTQESDMMDEYGDRESAMEYALMSDDPAIALYDSSMLEVGAMYEYTAKEGHEIKDALIAAFSLKL